MALGADHGEVIWLVMREVLILVSVGMVAGVTGSLALTRVAQSQLFGLTPHDPLRLGIRYRGPCYGGLCRRLHSRLAS
jgi:putative ABC transport system permease protein